MDGRARQLLQHASQNHLHHVSRPAAASASTASTASTSTSAPISAPIVTTSLSTPVVPSSSSSSTIIPGLPDSPRRNSKLQLHTGPRAMSSSSSGTRSLQTQLSHLYHHHQNHSAHSPYIDFQNVLLSQTPGLSSRSNGRVHSFNNHSHHNNHHHFHLLDPVFGPVSPMNVLASDAPPSSAGPFMQGSPRLGPAAAAAPSPVQAAASPAGPLQSNSGTAKENALAASPRHARLSQGITLDPAQMVLKSHSSSQSEKKHLAAHKPPEHTQQGAAAPVLHPPVNGVIGNHIASKKRRDSLTSAPLHLDMEMQVDSGPSLVSASVGGSNGNSSSTLTEFTKRRNWSQRIIEELQDLLCILTPSGKIRYTSPNASFITGYGGDELLGRMITDFVHTDDSHIFIRDFNESIASNQQLCLFFRFRRKDESYIIFESNGHPHFSDQRQMPANTTTPVCSGFFMMARLYPTKNTALLDSFLEHKIENERLKRRIAELRREEYEDQQAQLRAREALQSKGNGTNNTDPNNRLQVPTSAPRSISVPISLTERLEGSAAADSARQANSKSMPPPAMPAVPGQLTRQNLEGLINNTGLRSDSLRDKMARYEGVTHADTIEMLTGLRYNEGERSRGISTGDTSPSLIRGDVGVPMSADRDSRGSGERKKKIKVTNEYVCTDCGTLDSPEWRKGPTGPKTLCNACGLRWAKKEKKRGSVSGPSQPVPPAPENPASPRNDA
ncbi:blue light receptor [Orbilia brochopaga]|uniref:Blue light receptor n=1 Tax=Orbilia brochopaga TaxID=3140254 RepID=A0AAV9UDV0_9PEZI